MSSSLDRYRTMATEDLAGAYRELGGLARAVEAQRLLMLQVLIEREAYRLDGCLDAAQWVAATDLVPGGVARAMVRTAGRLVELPVLTAAAEAGRLSFAQLAPLAELADHESDSDWAQRGPGLSPAALLALVKERRRVSREQAEAQHRRRGLRWWNDRRGAGVRFAGLLPDDAAAIVTDALHRRADDLPRNEQGTHDPYDVRCADALVELCSADSGAAGHAEVVVHVPVGAERLAPTLPDGTPIAIDVVRRLACDATARLLVENPDGTVAGYGRRKRIVPEKMRARLQRRDKGCRWLGCGRTRGLRAHHLEHWVDGGATDEGNCVLLCSRHHHLVHEGGWTISGDPNRALEFRRPPWGTPIPAAPTPASSELRTRYGLDAA